LIRDFAIHETIDQTTPYIFSSSAIIANLPASLLNKDYYYSYH
jgi:hypothetical protein